MKKWKIFTTIASILIIIGIIITLGATIASGEQTENFTIPSGPYYFYFEAPQLVGGQVSGDYSISTGSVSMYFLTESQYNYYQVYGVVFGSLYSTSGSSQTFSVDLPDSGTIYIIFEHGSGYESISQSGTVHFETSGISVMYTMLGVALLVIGIILIIIGTKMKKKEETEGPPISQKPTDVTLFDQRQPPK